MRYKCEVGGIPEVNKMLRQIANENGVNTVDSNENWDTTHPHIVYDTVNKAISQCGVSYLRYDKIASLSEFIQLLKDSNNKKTSFGGHPVTLNKDGLIVGCHSFKIDEVKEFLKFLNEHIK